MDKKCDISDEKNKEAKRVLLLNERVKRRVCKSCGGKLSLRMLDFDEFEKTRIDIFCDNCDRLEFGIEPEIYQAALYYVQEYALNLYPDMGNTALSKKATVAKAAEMMSWVLKSLGYLSKDGFIVPPDTSSVINGECLDLTDHLLDCLEEELE